MHGKQRWILIGCILLSVMITIWQFKKETATAKSNTRDYIAAEATVMHVTPARITRFGATPEKYGLQFTAADGKTYTQYNCSLSGTKKVQDKVVIYYNPKNPHDPVTDQK